MASQVSVCSCLQTASTHYKSSRSRASEGWRQAFEDVSHRPAVRRSMQGSASMSLSRGLPKPSTSIAPTASPRGPMISREVLRKDVNVSRLKTCSRIGMTSTRKHSIGEKFVIGRHRHRPMHTMCQPAGLMQCLRQ